MEYKDTYNKSNDQIECDDLITDAHVSDALRYALIDWWTVNPHLPDTSALPNFQPRPQNQQRQIAVIGDQFTTAPGNTRRTHKVSAALNKFAIKESAKNALFSNGFRGVKH